MKQRHQTHQPRPKLGRRIPGFVEIIILLVIVGETMSGFLGMYLLGVGAKSIYNYSGEGVQGSDRAGQRSVQSNCPNGSIQVIRNNQDILNRISANIPLYKSAGNKNNLAWEVLAALHYRETNVGGSGPHHSGEGYNEGPFQLHTIAVAIQNGGGQATFPALHNRTITQAQIEDLGSSADIAAAFFQSKTNFSLTANSSDDQLKHAFHLYNGLGDGNSDDRNAYTMNNFDENHQHMVGYGGYKDTRDGAFTVYYLLHYLATYDSSGRITGFKDCQQATSSGGTDSVSGKILLNVPGVKENVPSACGHASVIMVVLYENQVEGKAFSDPANYDPTTGSTAGSVTGCVSDIYMNNHVPPDKSGWTRTNPSPDEGVAMIKRSLQGRDPVIFYGAPGLIFSSQHIFVIDGYDPSNDTFYVNNPNVGSVEVQTNTPNGKLLTADRLKQYFGGLKGTYNHTFLIRKNYT